MATIKDVAKEAGVTVTTVSRVLNNRGYIAQATREKVYEAMRILHYQPNEVARSLSKKTNHTIGVIVPHIVHPYFAKLVSNLEAAAYEKGFRMMLFNSREEEAREGEYLDLCQSNRVAGIILCTGTVGTEKFKNLNIPLITIERALDQGSASVECDNEQGGILAARHLIEKGCREIINLGGTSEVRMPADVRTEAFRKVCEEEGVKHHEIPTNLAYYNNLEYKELIEQVLEQYPEADGIFASSDLIAAQVLQVCAGRRIDIPGQMKVVGFDDVNIASLVTPAITTIRQPIGEMARMAVTLLKDTVEGNPVTSKNVLPVTLVERETT